MERNVFRSEAGVGPASVYGLTGCPRCGPVELHPAFDGELTNFYCPLCGTCWHAELGWIVRVNPATCPGCHHELLCRERSLGARQAS
jgi:hypothetical protein